VITNHAGWKLANIVNGCFATSSMSFLDINGNALRMLSNLNLYLAYVVLLVITNHYGRKLANIVCGCFATLTEGSYIKYTTENTTIEN